MNVTELDLADNLIMFAQDFHQLKNVVFIVALLWAIRQILDLMTRCSVMQGEEYDDDSA